MREKNVESAFIDAVKGQGGLALKLVSPGFNGMPDRLVIFPGGIIAYFSRFPFFSETLDVFILLFSDTHLKCTHLWLSSAFFHTIILLSVVFTVYQIH